MVEKRCDITMPLKKPRLGFEWQSHHWVVLSGAIWGEFSELAGSPLPTFFMERYLSFELSRSDAEQSDFALYTLGNTSLLPHYFGDIAPVNVFLGENNSGKSRFMRAIMKCNPTKLFDISNKAQLKIVLDEAASVIGAAPTDELHKISVTASPDASSQASLMDFLSVNAERLQRDRQKLEIEIQPVEVIQKLFSIISSITEKILSDKFLLDYMYAGGIDEDLEEIKGYRFSLKRIAIIYERLWDRQTYGISLNSHTGSSISYAFVNGGLVVYPKNPEETVKFTRRGDYVKKFGARTSKIVYSIINAIDAIVKVLSSMAGKEYAKYSRTYIPALRTARTLFKSVGSAQQEDIIEATIDNDYKLVKEGVSINTGLSLYSAIDGKKNSRIENWEEFERFEKFLSETFFDGKPVRVGLDKEDRSILVAVNREERAFPHLGDGIQAIILLLYPFFIAPKGMWFFIEEPETHLHPGFQRLFIETIANHSVIREKNLKFFLTTHSNHLLDFVLDEPKRVNIFTFRKKPEILEKSGYQIQITKPGDLSSLNILGVQNTSIFLSNCTIWIEGITDRFYLKTYLKIYLEYRKSKGERAVSLLEGMHYSFLEYAGSNVTHYEFAARSSENDNEIITPKILEKIKALSISNRIMLIADRDAGAAKEERQAKFSAQQHDGFEFVVLNVREIENLLKPIVITESLHKVYKTRKFDSTLLVLEEYRSEYLASYLKEKISSLPKSFVGKSGTICSSKKRQFAEAAAEVITSWEMLSSEAQELTEQVFQFIMRHNPRLGSN